MPYALSFFSESKKVSHNLSDANRNIIINDNAKLQKISERIIAWDWIFSKEEI